VLTLTMELDPFFNLLVRSVTRLLLMSSLLISTPATKLVPTLLWLTLTRELLTCTFLLTLLLMLVCHVSFVMEEKCGTRTTNCKKLSVVFLIDLTLEFTKLLSNTAERMDSLM
jgi:hypothetical protein